MQFADDTNQFSFMKSTKSTKFDCIYANENSNLAALMLSTEDIKVAFMLSTEDQKFVAFMLSTEDSNLAAFMLSTEDINQNCIYAIY